MKNKTSNILIVEDNQSMRKMLESMLIELGYHNYATAVNGLKAWDRIQEGDIDVVLCDYLMPEMNGIELLRLIRQTRRFYDLPFIMITGADKRGDFMRSVQAEVDYYLIKPPNINQLDDLVKKVVAHRRYPTEYDKAISNGKYLFLNMEYDKALESFEAASKARIDSALPYYYLGLIYQQLGNGKNAELNFKKSLVIEEQFISALLALAEIYQANEDYVNLAYYLQKVTDIMPDTFDIHIGLARACTRTGDIDRAQQHLDEAQQLAKNNADQIKEVLDGYIEAGLVDEADLLFGKKIQDDNIEKTIHFLNKLGLRSRKNKDFDKAKYFYMSCLKLDPQHKVVNYNLSSLLFLQKQYDDAESYLKKTLRLYPDFEKAHELMEAVQQRLTQKS
ncbi:MAG: response regulator [Proteobacteria bacterium]|nr:response regulator [Pseudomonadota bacterium]MBU4297051.1 response regulator [Pseudomonadota bacterium]MCG2749932.1 response regulator [Desulfobulbaceae bacterium]